MQISEQNPYSNPYYNTGSSLPHQNVDTLFSLKPDEILPFVDQNLVQSSFADLLNQVWTHHARTNEEKTKVIQILTSHELFEQSLWDFFTNAPITALFILISIEEKETIKSFLERFFDTYEEYTPLSQCCNYLANVTGEDPSINKEILEKLLSLLDHSQRKRLFHNFIKQFDFFCHANLLSMMRDNSEYSGQFIYRWGRVYEYMDNLNENLSQFVQILIQQFLESNIEKPNLLYELITFNGNRKDFLFLTFENLHTYVFEAQSMIAGCLLHNMDELLDELSANYCFTRDYEELTNYLNALISTPISVSEKIHIVRMFFDRINLPNTLRKWLEQIQNTFSPIAPFLWIALSDEAFSSLVTQVGVSLRTNMLRLSTAKSIDPLDDLIVELYQYPHRVEFILSVCTLDIASQNQIQLGDELIATWLTFNDLRYYLQGGMEANNLDDMMTQFQEDFQIVPPFLFAIGLQHDEHQNWIINVARYCSEEQLQSIAQAIPHNRSIDIIDYLSTQLMTHQIELIINNLPYEIFTSYLRLKGQNLETKLKEIQILQNELRLHLEMIVAKENTSDQFVQETRDLLLNQNMLLSGIETPIMRILQKVSLERQRVSSAQIWKKIPICLQALDDFKVALNNDYHLMQQSNINETQPFEFYLENLPAQTLASIGANSWEDIGISSPNDLKHIGYQLDNQTSFNNYLIQPELVAIWAFFKSKHLATLDDFINLRIVEPQDLFDLKSIAIKLGWRD